MRVLVTGGAGFIGSTLVDRLLAEGHDVDVVDDLSTGSLANLADARAQRGRRFTFHRLDVRSAAMTDLIIAPQARGDLPPRRAGRRVTVSVAKPVFDAEVNILGSLNVCQGAVAAGTRKVVFAGLGRHALRRARVDCRSREGHPQHPLSPYGVAKKAVGDYLHYYREIHGLEYTVLALAERVRAAPGPARRSRRRRDLRGKLLDKDRPTIFGDGEQTRDFVFVDDVVDAFVRATDKGGGLIVNIGTGVETSVQQLYDAMARLTGLEEPARYAPPRAGELRRSSLDPGRADDPPRLEAVDRPRRRPQPHPRVLPRHRGARR